MFSGYADIPPTLNVDAQEADVVEILEPRSSRPAT
jgi:hypothetical protein